MWDRIHTARWFQRFPGASTTSRTCWKRSAGHYGDLIDSVRPGSLAHAEATRGIAPSGVWDELRRNLDSSRAERVDGQEPPQTGGAVTATFAHGLPERSRSHHARLLHHGIARWRSSAIGSGPSPAGSEAQASGHFAGSGDRCRYRSEIAQFDRSAS